MTTTELNTPMALPSVGEMLDPLGPLALLPGPGNTPGIWTGHGFNAIWLPNPRSAGQKRFLQLNLTDETIMFTRISGGILNRGLAMPDIQMHGVTYTQQSNAAGEPDRGLHIEPGICPRPSSAHRGRRHTRHGAQPERRSSAGTSEVPSGKAHEEHDHFAGLDHE